MKKILSIILISIMLGTTFGCSTLSKIVTEQTEESIDALEILNDAERICAVIINTSNIALETELITEDSYKEITKYATVFETELNTLKDEINKWQDIEDSIKKDNGKEAILITINTIVSNLNEFTNLLELAGIEKHNIQIIKASIMILSNVLELRDIK